MTLPNGTKTDIFCSAQIVLPQSGNILIAGGDNWNGYATLNSGNNNTNIFAAGDSSLTPSGVMNRPRWYATPTTLPNGSVYIQGGQGGEDFPEVRDPSGNFTLLTGAPTSSLFALYPRAHVAPNGLIFGYSDLTMYWVDPSGIGKITMLGDMPNDGPSGLTSTDVMYAPGKILRCGGGSNTIPERGGVSATAKNAAAIIDITGSTPAYKKQSAMPKSLHWANATVLADGTVCVTGGSTLDTDVATRNTAALLWKPGTGNWTIGATSRPDILRAYHSTAILLPDGSVPVWRRRRTRTAD